MSTIRTSPSDPRLAGRAGFTLLELLVALTISGMLAGVILQLVQGNGRFVQLQSAREEVQQNGRAALDLIGAELRSLPPGGIVDMQPNALQLRVPRAWGVLCNVLGTTSSTAWVLFGANSFPGDEAVWGRPHWGLAVEQTTSPTVSTGVYRFVENVTEQPVGAQCDAIRPAGTPGPVPERYGFSTGGRSLVNAGTIPAGTPVQLYEEVRYDVAAGGSAPGFWIRRMSGYTGSTPNMQPMAGPVPGVTSLTFAYFRQDGTTTATVPTDVRQIRVTIVTESRSRTVRDGVSTPAETDTVTADIHLRN